jgi:hypothetical protein
VSSKNTQLNAIMSTPRLVLQALRSKPVNSTFVPRLSTIRPICDPSRTAAGLVKPRPAPAASAFQFRRFWQFGDPGCGLLTITSAAPLPYPLCTPNSIQGHPMSPNAGVPNTRVFRVLGGKAERIGRGSQPRSTDDARSPDHPILFPRRHFPSFVVNTTLHLNRPLGLPCVTLG